MKYELVEWPQSQFLIEHPRFNECLLVQDIDGHEQVGSSAYMVPEDLVEEIFINNILSGENCIYEVVAKQYDCEGKHSFNKTLIRFKNLQDAINYKKVWERLWSYNKQYKIAMNPCWINFAGELQINKLEYE